MKSAHCTYKGYSIHRITHSTVRTYHYEVGHPIFGDVWFERLSEAKVWIDNGCPQFGKFRHL